MVLMSIFRRAESFGSEISHPGGAGASGMKGRNRLNVVPLVVFDLKRYFGRLSSPQLCSNLDHKVLRDLY